MARYQKIVNIWDHSVDRSKLQPGQWVECGVGGDRGIWCGQRNGSKGSDVVAFNRAILSRKDDYLGLMFNYAKGI